MDAWCIARNGLRCIKGSFARATAVAELVRTAVAQGMRTLRQDGIEKILQGQTSWEQVRAI
jgi:type II secretory ATPase GspE/PulE/Tfp pilus assembly ATPase PilB-like protein